jgi:type III secretion protein R
MGGRRGAGPRGRSRTSAAAGAVCTVAGLLAPALAAAEQAAPVTGAAPGNDGALSWVVAVGAVSLLPFLFVSVTSFAKISVVLGILRHAIGTPQVPSATVVTGLALILTLYVMAPVLDEVGAQALPRLRAGPAAGGQVDAVLEIGEAAREPIRRFLRQNASPRNVELFRHLARRRAAPDDAGPAADDLVVLAPAFVVTELAEAFLVGFLLFVPFLVIDLVVSNTLLALGMHMLSPLAVSLPLKLLLFVMVDGWQLVCYGLVTAYD